jgi:uncharacterized protein
MVYFRVKLMKEPILFDWDEKKNERNIKEQGISFNEARKAFFDENRIIIDDVKHSENERRLFCIACITDPETKTKRVITVRFTYRDDVIRIIGAGFWRKGREFYEKENQT